jgi:hypothetical protein
LVLTVVRRRLAGYVAGLAATATVISAFAVIPLENLISDTDTNLK